jgi:hypothetical protein
MKRHCVRSLALLGACSWVFAQGIPPRRGLLERRYREGETLVYRMKAINEVWRYEAQASGVVKKDSSGAWIEEYAWSSLISNGAPFSLPPASVEFRQVLSLDPGNPPAIPNLAVVHPTLIGPITDLLTFYVDLWLAEKVGTLSKPGDHAYQENGNPASWADGKRVVLGESSIDFDITLSQVDVARGVATLLVRHVPPKKPQLKLPAVWMHEPVADTPNNWVSVARNAGKYIAEVGKETFDVQITISLLDGKILSGTIYNPVKAQARDCQDAALTNCGTPRPHHILRQIEISLIH